MDNDQLDIPRGDIRFEAANGEGQRRVYHSLFMYDMEETGQSYIVYTDYSLDEYGDTNVFVSVYDPANLEPLDDTGLVSIRLSPLETDREWDVAKSVLDNLLSQLDEA